MDIEKSRKKLEDIKKATEAIGMQRKINKEANTAIPIAENRLKYIKFENENMERRQTPEIVSNCKNNIEEHLSWFVEQEKEYPSAHWLIVGGAEKMIIKLKNRHNELLYLICKDSFDRYKITIKEVFTESAKDELTVNMLQGIENIRLFIDTKAENSKECFDSLKDIHFQVEELYS